ncbi:MAG: hypothetical protein NTZ27_05290 [Ignavibacteriales bacterium]|nr:hypothetical protein [Ignavibacteriales bacterium]
MIELSKYLQDENLAERYLLEKGILKTWTNCPHCNSNKIGKISRSRIKCYKCKKEWHKRKDSILEGRHISAAKFIALLKLFLEDNNPVMISKEIEVERRAVLYIINSINNLILKDYSILGENNNRYVLYVLDEKIIINKEEVNSCFKNKSYMRIEPIRYRKFGNIYSFLLNSKWIGKKTNDFNTVNNFLSFLKVRSLNYAGISEKYFMEYLFIVIFKFNNRSRNFFETVLEMINFNRVVETTQPHDFSELE